MKEVSVLIICWLLISVVGGVGVTCKAGEGAFDYSIFTSGPASQCSGWSKITTAEECKAAAIYNKKSKIDDNIGYNGELSRIKNPPGCIYKSSDTNKYEFNDHTEAKGKCSKDTRCICKRKICIKCPITVLQVVG